MKRWIAAFKNSVAALRHGFKHEVPIREEIILFALSLLIAPFLAQDAWHLLLLWGVILLILIVEFLNTGIEALADELTLERRENIKIAKDCGSAAVLLASVIAAGVWAVSLWQYFA
jgi:diacylglycerol kinase (ATP)